EKTMSIKLSPFGTGLKMIGRYFRLGRFEAPKKTLPVPPGKNGRLTSDLSTRMTGLGIALNALSRLSYRVFTDVKEKLGSQRQAGAEGLLQTQPAEHWISWGQKLEEKANALLEKCVKAESQMEIVAKHNLTVQATFVSAQLLAQPYLVDEAVELMQAYLD